jgi:LuxR family maltose regulon positive regulatory protein
VDLKTTAHIPNWIPLTKFMSPRIGADVLWQRPLLHRLSKAVSSKPLSLISAPAGSGKSTLAASLQTVDAERPLIWLSLDEDDDDPALFLWLLTAAISHSFPACAANSVNLIQDLEKPAVELKRVLGVLINDVLQSDLLPFTFVIDDYHLLESPSIQQAMRFLIEHLPPNWHMLLLTRRDPPLPLARYRARNQLATFTRSDLQFQVDEVQDLFTKQFALSLPEEWIATVCARTDGWIAGLQLLANNLQELDDPEKQQLFINQMGAADRHVYNLLADEVLNQQPPELRAFLLETSILRELTPDLCRAVTGVQNAARLLAEVERRHLFISTVGDFENVVSPVYRYHDLFAQFLYHRLTTEQPERAKLLHRRAAEAVTSPARAVRHCIESAAWPRLVQIIETLGPEILSDGQSVRLEAWLSALPEEIRLERPRLNYLLAMCIIDRTDFGQAEPLLQTAIQQYQEAGDDAGEAMALGALAVCVAARHDFAQVEILLSQVLDKADSPFERVRAYITRAWQMMFQNDLAQVEADVKAAIRVTLASEDRAAIGLLARQLTPGLMIRPELIDLIQQYHQTILSGLEAGPSLIRAGSMAPLTTIALLRGEFDQAAAMAHEAQAMSSQLGGMAWMDLTLDLAIYTEAMVRADYPRFENHWQRRRLSYEQTWALPFLFIYDNLRARVLWMQGRKNELNKLARTVETREIPFENPESVAGRHMISALADRQNNALSEAEERLRQAVALQKEIVATRTVFDARILLAHLYLTQNRRNDAADLLKQALTHADELGISGLLVMEGRTILPLLELAMARNICPQTAELLRSRFVTERTITLPGSGEKLTPREVEVLGLLLDGASNKEIAVELVITQRTAKAHVSNIMGKLGVSSRTEAVAKAYELGLIRR